MKLRIKDPVELCCAKCRKKIIVNPEEVRYEADVCADRSMGPEIQHNLGYCNDCPHCKLVYETNGASWWQNNKPILLDENGNEVEHDT